MKPTVLLLGGTREARLFAEQFDDPRFRLIASLAGVTREPLDYPCETRIGGFGGAVQMAAFLRAENVAAVVDATHPFAQKISANAHEATALADARKLTLRRPPWQIESDWRGFETEEILAEALPAGARVFLTSGRGGLDVYAKRTDVDFVLRSIEPVENLPPHIMPILKRPPYSFEDEYAAFNEFKATHLVTKNSGGLRPAKLDAAKALGVQVFSIAMPPAPAGDLVHRVDEALHWLKSL